MIKDQPLKKEELDSVKTISKETSNDANNTLPVKNKINKKKYVIIGFVILVILTLALGSYLFSERIYDTKDIPLQNITVALSWIHQSEFAGNYIAAKKGFYAAKELNVSLISYNFEDLPIDLVASGKAEFGITGASEVLMARSKGIPIKAIAVIYRVNPVCAFSLKSSGIKNPKDFIGKKIGIEKGINVEYDYIAMMNNLNINRSDLTEIGIGYDASELINGTVDVSTGYVDNEPYYAIAKGLAVNIIMVEEYGVNTYSDVLFTTDDLITQNPKLVNDFVQATLHGWQYSIENEDETIEIIMQYTEDKDISHQRYGLKTSFPLISTGDVPIGSMNEEGWLNVKKYLLMQEQNISSLNVSDCYTTQFINSRDV